MRHIYIFQNIIFIDDKKCLIGGQLAFQRSCVRSYGKRKGKASRMSGGNPSNPQVT